MKRLLLFTLLFIIYLVNIYSQWTNQNPVPDDNDLWSTFFLDDTGWIVGSEGFIKKTTNAGIDWFKQNSGTTTLLKAVKFEDEKIGWVVGESGLIMKTTNGGTDWITQNSGTTETLNSFDILDSNNLLVAGYGGIILKTTNGGNSWTALNSGTSNDLFSISFVSPTTGWAVGGLTDNEPPTIVKTTDGGINWTQQFVGTNMILYSVDFVDENNGFAVGTWGSIIKTTDGGNSWDQCSDLQFNLKERKYNESTEWIPVGYLPGYFNVFFKDPNNGWIVGNPNGYDSKILATTDAGLTWERKYRAWEQRPFLSMFITEDGTGWAVGTGGVIGMKEDNDSDWSLLFSGYRDQIHSIHFVDENIGWAAAYRIEGNSPHAAVVLKTTNGGKIWKSQFVDYSNLRMVSVYFINELIGWTLEEKYILKTTDGGENWNVEFNFGNPTSSVFFINQDTGWVTKDDYNAGIYKSTNGGDTWAQKSSVSSTSIYFSDLNNGWAVGKGGSILKSTDSGETWVTKTSGTTNDLNCVKFYNLNLGICVGNAGTVLLSTDSGQSWVSKNIGTAEIFTAVSFTNSSTVWIAGSNGTIVNTTDLGTNWIYYDGAAENDLSSLFFLNENTGWIGGENGTLFKYQNDVVPVELVSFTGHIKDNTLQLDWRTATEVNNYGFNVERKIREGDWNTIGFIDGSGNSTLPKEYSFTDKDLFTGGSKFQYRLKQIDNDGTFEYSDIVEVEVVPTQYELSQNYPNPFNPSTTIRFSLPEGTHLKINIYNTLGELVDTIAEGTYEAGYHKVTFTASSLPSGAYIYRIESSGFVHTKKMLLLK